MVVLLLPAIVMSLANKRQAIRDFKREHPEASYTEIRTKFGCSYSTISDALRKKEPEEPSLIDEIALRPSKPLMTGVQACPKTWLYLVEKRKWCHKNGRRFEESYLSECLKEMEALV